MKDKKETKTKVPPTHTQERDWDREWELYWDKREFEGYKSWI